MEEFMLPCLNKQFFGLDCLGCGAQRAFLMVLQGDFKTAFHLYPAIYPILLLLLFLITDLFIKIKNAWPIKIGLIILSAVIIIGSYFLKISHSFS